MSLLTMVRLLHFSYITNDSQGQALSHAGLRAYASFHSSTCPLTWVAAVHMAVSAVGG